MRLRLLSAACLLTLAALPAAAQGAFDCQSNVQKMMAERETAGKALQAANKRKADVQTACGLLKTYVGAENKLLKYLTANKTACAVPDQFIGQLTKSHAQSAQMTTKVCQIAANGGPAAAKPPSQGLSEALGVNTTGSNTVNGEKPSALFDTLHGNVLSQ